MAFAPTGAPGPAAEPMSLIDTSPPRPSAASNSDFSLLELDDTLHRGGRTANDGGGAEQGLLANFTPAVLEKPTVIDLSVPAPADQAGASNAPAVSSSSAPAGPRTLPADSKGFGSDDLFGSGQSQDRGIQGDALAAYSAACAMLPDPIKQNIPSCMAPPPEDPSEELVVPLCHEQPNEARVRGQQAGGVPQQLPGGQPLPRQAGVAPSQQELEQQHAAAAVQRACEGRWVPTYMRHQMAVNGHTAVPTTAPNAHEHHSAAEPPTLGRAFADMSTDVGETAQNMITFVMVVISSLATQLQMCSHQVASVAHDQVVTLGDNMCYETHADQSEEQVATGPLSGEAAVGLGPVRSRVTRIMEVKFAKLFEIAKCMLVTPYAPPEFQRAVKARSISRQPTDDWERGIEDIVFLTEVNQEAVPNGALHHVVPGFGPLMCREVWHVEKEKERAAVEISSAMTGGAVIITLRVDIVGKPESDGGGCEVDSRLYAQPKEHGQMLPLGLVEQLTEVHHMYSESLRGIFLALSARGGSGKAEATPADNKLMAPPCTVPQAQQTAGSGPPFASPAPDAALGKVQWSFPEKRATPCATEGMHDKRSAGGLEAPRDGGKTSPVDAALLMQVADGI